MTGEPLISVIIPARDVAPWLRQCLESILRQTEVGLQVIVVDDASRDDTAAIARARAASDPRLLVVPSQGSGAGPARNTGIRHATGDWLGFADADDLVTPGAYAALLGTALRSGAELVVGRYRRLDDNQVSPPLPAGSCWQRPGVFTVADQPELLRQRQCWNRLIRRDCWQAHGAQFAESARANDIRAMTGLLLGARRIAALDQVVYHYRARPGNQSITARQGELGFFLDYLGEELACAQLCLARPEREIHKTYAVTALRRDLPKNLMSMLAANPRLNHPDAVAVQTGLRQLLRAVRNAPIARATAELAVAIEQASCGQWAAAAGSITALWSPQPSADPLVHAEGLLAVAPQRLLPDWMYRHVFTTLVLAPLLALDQPGLARTLAAHGPTYRRCAQAWGPILDPQADPALVGLAQRLQGA
jgi:hypothetical protein